MQHRIRFSLLLAVSCLFVACSGQDDDPASNGTEGDIYALALGCFAVGFSESSTFLAPSPSGDRFESTVSSEAASARFFLKPADLGVYLFYDQDAQYLVSDGATLLRRGDLGSDTTLDGDTVVVQPGALRSRRWRGGAARTLFV